MIRMSTGRYIEHMQRQADAIRAFSRFVDKCQAKSADSSGNFWSCCSEEYPVLKDLHRHVATCHSEEIGTSAQELLRKDDNDSCLLRHYILKGKKKNELQLPESDKTGPGCIENEVETLPGSFKEEDDYPWFPRVKKPVVCHSMKKTCEGRVLLFYHYRDIQDTTHVCQWQEALCKRLNLAGKIRVSCEGLNATVGGSVEDTQVYMQAVLKHPLFIALKPEEFKESPGGSHVFPGGLKVGVYSEACPMGVDPQHVSFKDTGHHLSPREFHKVLEKYHSGSDLKEKALFIDCRNFYEWKIGKFKGALTPDIRKFSYWPEYVEKNKDLFENKQVYMYCTGGIRCERGSAYLRNKGICDEVYQLQGGIHKYIEEFPEGYFRGKLFVFDDRYSIPANGDVISRCVYCNELYDQYEPCSSPHCHQLVLSCVKCRDNSLTACCRQCQKNTDNKTPKEECQCTINRPRIPQEVLDSAF